MLYLVYTSHLLSLTLSTQLIIQLTIHFTLLILSIILLIAKIKLIYFNLNYLFINYVNYSPL
jgi:hypothetical protein